MSVVANRYCEALFEFAIEDQFIDECYVSLKLIRDVLFENKDLVQLFSHPEIELVDKLEIAKDSFSSIEKNTLNFFLILIEKKRVSEIFNVFQDFEAMYFAHKGIEVATVYSAVKLTDSQINKLIQQLNKKHNKEFTVENIVDEEIIGGIKIKIKNYVYDNSLKSSIEELTSELHSIQINR